MKAIALTQNAQPADLPIGCAISTGQRASVLARKKPSLYFAKLNKGDAE
jgi:hypothetical protein